MGSTTKLNVEDVLLLEQSTLKAPLESLRKIQKMTQKTYEHNLGPASSFQRELDELLSKLDSGNIDSLKVVEGMLSRMKTLKRKLSELETQSKSTISITKSRLNYLNSIPTSIDSPSYPTWSQKRLSTHLVDYFLRSSPAYKNSAEKLIQEEDVGEFVDVALWRELSIAEDGLREKKLAGALVWVGENRVALKRMKSSLEFTLHLQGFIELCRTRKLTEAIVYAKKNLSTNVSNEKNLADLENIMGLLAFNAETTCLVYKRLYSESRWNTLLAQFRSTFLQLHSLPSLPLLHLSLSVGLSSLKTQECAKENTTPSNHTNCPICSSPLKVLSTEVPFSHHASSHIVCYLSGKLVEGGNDADQLLALMSKSTGHGNVYSKQALLLAAESKEGNIIDPKTLEVFKLEDAKKVYVI